MLSEVTKILDDISPGDFMKLTAENLVWGGELNCKPFGAIEHLSSIESKDRDAVNWLYSQSWFERVWVIQEVAFAPSVIHIGSSRVSWKVAAVAAFSFDVAKMYGDLNLEHVWKVLMMFTLSSVAGSSYCSQLGFVNRFKATDPRDKLFAILGLSNDADRFNPAFQLDYTKNVVDVYMDFTRYLAGCRSGTVLGGFYWLYKDLYEESDVRFPSWVIRWDHIIPVRGITERKEWEASGETVATVDVIFSPRVLSLKGFLIGKVEVANHTLHEEWPWMINHYSIKSMWDDFMGFVKNGNLPDVITKRLDEDFVQTITNLTSSRPIWKDCWGAAELHSYLNCLRMFDSDQKNLVTPLQLEEVGHFIKTVSASRRTFFILDDGQIGLGPIATQPEDIGCVFFGHKSPYMFRQTAEGKLLLLGPCYIHGIMYGEAMEALKGGRFKEEWLHLC